MRIAILGASSHIARDMVLRFGQDTELFLFGRSPGYLQYDSFPSFHYDTIINCVGVRQKTTTNLDPKNFFTVTETYDNMVLKYLEDHGDTQYISFSSGAIYYMGTTITPENYYGIARVNAEAKHRASIGFRIVDLRIFSYFSRQANLDDGFFISDVVRACRDKTVLITDPVNITRDYLHPDDLYQAVSIIINNPTLNRFFDLYSYKPVTKFVLLDWFEKNYGLRYEVKEIPMVSSTGPKICYYSDDHGLDELDYVPNYSSFETVSIEAGAILGEWRG